MQSLRSRLETEQIKQLFRNCDMAFFGSMTCFIATSYVLASRTAPMGWSLWTGANLGLYVLRMAVVVHYRRLPSDIPAAAHRYWKSFFLLSTIASGTGWGLGVLILPDEFTVEMLFVLVLLGLTSSATTAYSVVPWVSEAFILPPMLTLSVYFAGKSGDIYGVIAALTLVYSVAMCITAKRMHASFNDSRRYGLENERLAKSLRQSERKYRLILDNIQDVLYQTDLAGKIAYVSPSVEHLLGYAPEAAIGMNLADLYVDPQGREKLLGELSGGAGGRVAGNRAELRRRDGGGVWTSTNAHFYRDKEGNIAGVEGSVRDISENKRLEDELWQLANFDALTGIPGRRLFYDRLAVCLAHAQRSGLPGVLMFIDLDDFKAINDQLGHDVGDQYLCEVSRRLVAAVRKSDTVARMGGDEFTVLLPEIASSESAHKAIEKIQETLAQPALLGDEQRPIAASIGITVFPAEGDTVDKLMKTADQKMYDMKTRLKQERRTAASSAIAEDGLRSRIPRDALNAAMAAVAEAGKRAGQIA